MDFVNLVFQSIKNVTLQFIELKLKRNFQTLIRLQITAYLHRRRQQSIHSLALDDCKVEEKRSSLGRRIHPFPNTVLFHPKLTRAHVHS